MNTPDESPVPFPSQATTNPPSGVTAIAATFWAVAVVVVLAWISPLAGVPSAANSGYLCKSHQRNDLWLIGHSNKRASN